MAGGCAMCGDSVRMGVCYPVRSLYPTPHTVMM